MQILTPNFWIVVHIETQNLNFIKNCSFKLFIYQRILKNYRRSQTILSRETVLYTDYESAYYDFWRSCDSEDWINDAETAALLHRNKLYFKVY